MVAFDLLKFLQHIGVIAVLFAVMTWLCDQIYPAYEQAFVTTGLCTNLSFQVMTILHYGVDAFIIIGFILACVNAIAAAQTRRNELMGMAGLGSAINTGITGSIVCSIFILSAIVLNYVITAFFDIGISTVDSALPIAAGSPFEVSSQLVTLFNFGHYVPLMIMFSGYLYMLFGSIVYEVIDALWS